MKATSTILAAALILMGLTSCVCEEEVDALCGSSESNATYCYAPHNIVCSDATEADINDFVNDGTIDLTYGQQECNLHALSKVNFGLKQREGEAVSIIVTSIDLVGVKTTGDFLFSEGRWTNLGNESTITNIYKGNCQLSHSAMELNNSGVSYAIPQPLKGREACLRVACRIEQEGLTVYEGAIDYPLVSAETPRWEVGEEYGYVMEVGVPSEAQAIGFSVSVDDWGEY